MWCGCCCWPLVLSMVVVSVRAWCCSLIGVSMQVRPRGAGEAGELPQDRRHAPHAPDPGTLVLAHSSVTSVLVRPRSWRLCISRLVA